MTGGTGRSVARNFRHPGAGGNSVGRFFGTDGRLRSSARRKNPDERAARPYLRAAGAAAWIFLCGCAWHITPPGDPAEPATVHLTEYKRHTRLALPAADETGRWVEYGFGEWNYYGLERRDLVSGLRALAGLGTAARSRRELPAADGDEAFLRFSGGRHTASIRVEKAAVTSLKASLERDWAALQTGKSARRKDGVPVVISPSEPYHLFHNSNHATASWLKKLGCKVTGTPILSNYRIRPAN
jgi:hypothetical protein